MSTLNLKKYFVAGFVALAAFSCSGNVHYEPDKDHHTKNGFKTKSDRSFIDWLSMRFKEGDYPSVSPEQAQTILAEADIKNLIHQQMSPVLLGLVMQLCWCSTRGSII